MYIVDMKGRAYERKAKEEHDGRISWSRYVKLVKR